ncbi:hypothetical protein [Ferrimonas pelagia]|uniref:hypothetical protein n=1 Tax=Ferrimonas pelagia TaxID=1177826 RepID=UPI0031E691D8
MKVKASDLISWNRLDLGIKMALAESLSQEYQDTYYKEAYRSHIFAITEGTLLENGNESKNSYDSFESSFEETFSSIREHGFDDSKSKVPVALDGSIINGAHRVSSAAYLGDSVVIEQTKEKSKSYDYNFFLERGVDISKIELGVRKLTSYSKNIRVACLWPSASTHSDKLLKLLEGTVVYEKELELGLNGVKNLVCQFYQGEPWLGTPSSGFSGSVGKAIPCYAKGGKTKVYWFERNDRDLVELKEKFRSIIGTGKHSVHMTDDEYETRDISDLLLKDDGVEILNQLNMESSSSEISNIFSFKAEVAKCMQKQDDFLVVGSLPLSLYNLRKADDIDYIHASSVDCTSAPHNEVMDSHNKYSGFFKYSVDELVKNDRCWVKLWGVKLLTIELLKDFKANRGEQKDKIDLELIGTIGDRSFWKDTTNKCRVVTLRARTKVKYSTAGFLKHIGLFNVVQKLRGKAR